MASREPLKEHWELSQVKSVSARFSSTPLNLQTVCEIFRTIEILSQSLVEAFSHCLGSRNSPVVTAAGGRGIGWTGL